ncbi:hypothetical protein L1049_026822 [Liquidambar formosana]|uniref:Uncharacterized protein n=1 Tax=Liquidambar formosana TaxID=63359 RepID=A0AAP0NDC8_LIQFO
MKLRSCGHLHFIQAIRGSSVVKVLNVDSRRRTALVFKKVKDIYETEDAKNPDSLSTRQPKDGFRGLYFECDREKIESPCHPMGERKTIKSDPETYDLNCSAGDNERDSELDDLSFGKMTLKQLKARCKTKKRKLSKFIDFTDENVETCSPVKQEYSDLRSEEEEFDLKEPLSHWKSMLTKKRKRINKCASSPSQSANSVKSEESPSDQDLLHSSVKLSARINIKAEVSDSIYSDCQNLVHVADDSSIGCNEQVGSCGVASSEMLGTSDGCALETGESISFTKEPRSCVVNEVSYDHLEYAEPNSLPNVADMGRDTMTVDDSEMSSHHSSVLPVPELKKQEDIIHTSFPDISPEILSPLKDHNSDVYDSSQSHSFPHEMSWQINSNAGAQLPEMAIDNGLQCVELSHGGGACVFEDESKDDLSSNTEAGAASSPESNFCSSFYSNPCSSPDSYLVSVDDDSPTTDSFPHEMSWQINSSAGARLPEMAIDNSLQCVELSHGVGACAVEDDSKDDLPSNTEAGARSSHESFCSSCNSNPCSSPDSCLVSMEDDSPTADEEQSLISTSGNTSRKCSASIQLSDASAELSTSEVVGIYHYSELRHPPERLLSTRKAISPTSQERLCKAMDAIELHDDIKNYKCRVKLSFKKQTENKASSAGSDLEGAGSHY